MNRLLGELPIASLHAAGSLRQLADATRAVFGHLSRLRASRHYELERAVRTRARARARALFRLSHIHVSSSAESRICAR